MLRRYACVRQADQSDCGAAAGHDLPPLSSAPWLAANAASWRGPIGSVPTYWDWSRRRKGSAFQRGLSRERTKRCLPAPLPAIAHVRTTEGLGHFVVLQKLTATKAIVADPGRGLQQLSLADFCKSWTGYLLLLVPDETTNTKALSDTSVSPARRFVGLLSGHMSIVLEAVICAILMTLLGVATSYYVQHLVDSVLVRHEVRLLHALGIGMVIIVIFRTLLGRSCGSTCWPISGAKSIWRLIAGFARHLLCLPLKFFEMRQVGEILSRVNDTAKIREAISGTTTTMLVDGVLVIALLAVLWIYDLRLAMVATGFVPILVLTVVAHHPAAKRRSREAMEEAGQLSAHLVEMSPASRRSKRLAPSAAAANKGNSGWSPLCKPFSPCRSSTSACRAWACS